MYVSHRDKTSQKHYTNKFSFLRVRVVHNALSPFEVSTIPHMTGEGRAQTELYHEIPFLLFQREYLTNLRNCTYLK